MNERSRKMKGLSRRLMAWLLCCVFLVAASPVSATTAEDATPAASETVIEQQTEATTAEPVTSSIAETTTQSVSIDNTSADAGSSEAATGTVVEAGATEGTTVNSANTEVSSTEEGTSEDEESSALTSKMEGLGAYEVNAAADNSSSKSITIEQGETGDITVSNISKLNNWSCSPSVTGITVTKKSSSGGSSSSGYQISVEDTVAAGTYTLTVNYTTRKGVSSDTINLTVTASKPSEYTFTVTPNLDNVEAVYFAYNSNSDVSDSITFTPVTSGTAVTVNNFSKNHAGYILFFVKPKGNYLLTAADATGNGDVYSVDGNLGNIRAYPSINSIVAQAKAQGYVGVLGYKRAYNATNDMSQTIKLAGKSPDITVAATSDKTQGVKPNDELTFTITVTPGVIEKATVKDVEVTSLTINGQQISGVTLTNGADGKYTAQVKYTATEADCESGSVDLEITAKVSYDGTLGVSDGQSLSSSAYITKSAITTCAIADKNTVEYVLKYENADSITEYPEAIKESRKPEDITGVYSGTTVNVDTTYGKSKVDDPTNHGTWAFAGWYKGNDKVASFTMGDSHVKLKGTWTFTPYPNADLTITKTLSGNMYDSSAKFTFKVTYTKDGETKTETVELGKDETSRVISIPVGATVTITEDSKGYVLSVKKAKSGDSNLEYTKIDSGITFTMPSAAVSVVIDNSKNVTVDTGVILDTLPYILILAVVVIGGVLLISRRRNHDRA